GWSMQFARTCARCGYTYEGEEVEVAFQSAMGSRSTRTSGHKRSICVVCIQTDGDQVKQRNRYLVKAASTIKRHAAKYGLSVAAFGESYGGSLSQLAHDLEHQYKKGCSSCHGNYEKRGHGLQDITVYIVNRLAEPYYGTNVKLCCGTCNKAKGSLPPD